MDIRLNFNSFWGGFDKENNVWVWLLRQNHNVILDDNITFFNNIKEKEINYDIENYV